MEKQEKKLGIWIAVDVVLLLAIILIIAIVVSQAKKNNGNNRPTGTPAANTGSPTSKPSDVTNTPKPTETPTPVPTETPTPTATPSPTPAALINANAEVDANVLNVRTGAGTDKPQLTVDGKEVQLTQGDKLEIVGAEGLWYKVKLVVNEKVYDAFVYGPYVAPDDTVNITLAPTPTVYAEVRPISDTTFQEWYEIKATSHKQQGAPGNMDIRSRFDELGAYYVNKDAANDKVIYLTFDCGYELDYTGKTADILDILKKHNAKACFFLTKGFIDQATASAKRMKEEGHIVGNHTNNHPNLAKVSDAQIASELNDTAAYYKKMTGYEMDHYMRPPQGDFSVHSLKVTHDLGYKSIFWSISIYDDWNFTRTTENAQYHTTDFVKSVFRNCHHNGAIALIHAVSNENVAALDDVLTYLENQGYRFGTLDELK